MDGNNGMDRLYGGPGEDLLSGDHNTGFADYIHGGPDADRLFGYAGGDQIIGGDRADVIDTGQMYGTSTPDGAVDTVDCGGGSDTVYFEKGVDKINANCEKKFPY